MQLPWQDKAAALKKGLGNVKAGTQCLSTGLEIKFKNCLLGAGITGAKTGRLNAVME